MKTSTILITATLITPFAFVIGLSAAAVISIGTLAGISAIALNDYGKSISYAKVNVAVPTAQKVERHPFAA